MTAWAQRTRALILQPDFGGILANALVLGLAFSFVSPFMSLWGTEVVGMRPWQFGFFMTATSLSAMAVSTALARWSDPELGDVSPAEFIPIAEKLNLIEQLNNRLMDLAFAEAGNWAPQIRLAFNLSALQLCDANFATTLLT